MACDAQSCKEKKVRKVNDLFDRKFPLSTDEVQPICFEVKQDRF